MDFDAFEKGLEIFCAVRFATVAHAVCELGKGLVVGLS